MCGLMLGSEHTSHPSQYVGPEIGKQRSEGGDLTRSPCSLEIFLSRV